MDIMKNGSKKQKLCDEEAGERVSTTLQVVLKRNPAFSTFTSVWYI
jgi:hypothetical protein